MLSPNIIPALDNAKPRNRLTIAEHREQFEAKADRLLRLRVADPIDYVDTVTASNRLPMPPRLLDELEKLQPWFDREVHYTEGQWIERCRGPLLPPSHFLRPSTLRIHQPLLQTYGLLDRYLPDHWISRTDFSLDQPTASKADADRLRDELLIKHVVMPWRRAYWETQDYDDGGIYFRRHGDPTPQRGRDLLAYTSKPDKPTGGPAAHLDVRFVGKAACQRIGICRAPDLVNYDRLDRIHKSIRLGIMRWDDRAAVLFEQQAQKSARRERRKWRRPVWPSFTVRGMRCRLEYRIGSQLIAGDDEADLPSWDDFPNYPVQKVLDAAHFLYDAAIILPADRITKIGHPVSINMQTCLITR